MIIVLKKVKKGILCIIRLQTTYIMPIIIHLDRLMSEKKMTLNELSAKVGITLSNLSIIKNEKCRALRLTTLSAICKALDCQPGDVLEYVE